VSVKSEVEYNKKGAHSPAEHTQNRKKSNIVYGVILGAVVLALASMAFVL